MLLVLGIHLALRMTYPGSVAADDADLILFGQKLSLGYSEQPPLYSWICQPFFALFGAGALALALVHHLQLFVGCLFLYGIARFFCEDREAARLGAFTILLGPNLAWHSLTYLTHTNLLLVACLATLYTLLRLARSGRTADYLWFGLALGMGGLSKYNFVWFAAALAAAALTVPTFRRRVLDLRLALSASVAALVVLPHALWMWEHLGPLRRSLSNKAQLNEAAALGYFPRLIRGLGSMLLAVVAIVIPPWAALRLTLGKAAAEPEQPEDGFRRAAALLLDRFFLAAIALLLVQALAFAPSRFHERWLMPFAVVLPLWLFVRMSPGRLTPEVRRGLFRVLAVFAALYCVIRAVQVTFFADARRGPYPLKTSYRALAEDIRARVGDRPIILTPEREIGGNLLLYLPRARAQVTVTPLFQLDLPPGPRVVAWNVERAGSRRPPWRQLRRYLPERPIPDSEIRTVPVAPAAWGRPAPLIAWVVLE